jgi:hypothetical protein
MRVSNLWLLLSLVGLASAATSPALDLAQARVTPHPTSVAHYSHSTVKPKIKHVSGSEPLSPRERPVRAEVEKNASRDALTPTEMKSHFHQLGLERTFALEADSCLSAC